MEKRLDFFNLSISDALRESLSLVSLTLDLAYASLIYENEEIARETVEVCDYIDKLIETIFMRYGIAVKGFEDAKELIPTIRVANMLEQVSDGSQGIAELVLRKIELRPEVKHALMEGEEAVGIMRINEHELKGLTHEQMLMRLGVGLDVLAVKREDEWMISPERSFKFRSGDVVVLRGTREALKFLGISVELEEAVNKEVVELMREMKNYLEMSLYLGYSSLLYDSKGLATGAIAYREKIKRVKDKLRKRLFLIAREDEERAVNTLEFIDILSQISMAGGKIALSVEGRGRLHPILDRVDDESREQFMLVKVEEKSIWAKKRINELLLDDKMGVRIIGLKRRGRWMFDLADDAVIEVGDLILLGGYRAGIESLEEIGGEVKGEE